MLVWRARLTESNYLARLMVEEPRRQCWMQLSQFPCQYRARSAPPPTSVHRLQPADIGMSKIEVWKFG